MKWFRDDDWSWNGLRQPYRILERHPDLAFIEPHLQVMCFKLRCRPTWWKKYQNFSISHLSPPQGERPLDWRHDTCAFHFPDRNPPEFENPQALLKGKGMYAEMGRMVIEAADMVNHLK